MIEKLSKFWAGAIAYVALLVGAGLSVAGNVADTYRTRGGATDALDVILAGAWPVLVLLTIELFVSRRWSPEKGFQALRWIGCLSIGSMAMMVSWVHLHDLLSSRGQILPVATGGPLAIDGMAIMATGLLLSTRGRVHLSTAVATAPMRVAMSVADEASSWLDSLATMSTGVSTPAAPLDIRPVSPAPYGGPNAVRVVPLITAWETADTSERPTLKDMSIMLAAYTGRSDRTIRRHRDALLKG